MAFGQHHSDTLPGPVAGADWVKQWCVMRSMGTAEKLCSGFLPLAMTGLQERRAESFVPHPGMSGRAKVSKCAGTASTKHLFHLWGRP